MYSYHTLHQFYSIFITQGLGVLKVTCYKQTCGKHFYAWLAKTVIPQVHDQGSTKRTAHMQAVRAVQNRLPASVTYAEI